jgi:hypothetical protein
MRRAPIFAALLAAIILLTPARAGTYKMLEVGLYQPNPVLVQRLGNDAGALAAYIKALNAAGSTYIATLPSGKPATIDLVVAFKPSGASKVWIVDPSSALAKPADLAQKLETIHPPKSANGPVAFTVHVSLWGGSDNTTNYRPPIPAEWQAVINAAGKPLHVPDQVLPSVWKD